MRDNYFKNIMRDKELSLNAKGIFAYLYSYTEDNISISKETISNDLGIRKETLAKYIKELEEKRYMKKIKNKITGEVFTSFFVIFVIFLEKFMLFFY